MIRFTVEETNLICIYLGTERQALIRNIRSSLPFMDSDMRKLALHTIRKVKGLTEEEFNKLHFCYADDD